MAFETTVLSLVDQAVGDPTHSAFVWGTLFVDCSQSEADCIQTLLRDRLSTSVTVSAQSKDLNEFRFDFT